MLFGALLTGATQLQRVLQVPAALAVALNGIVVIFVVSSTPVRGWIQRSLSEAGLFNRHSDTKTESSRNSRVEPGGLSDMPDPSEGSEYV
jgi:ABC-type uncharacterized transport system permease subunit